MRRINIHIDEETDDSVDLLAEILGVSRSEVFRKAVALFSKSNKTAIEEHLSSFSLPVNDVVAEEDSLREIMAAAFPFQSIIMFPWQYDLFNKINKFQLTVIATSRQLGMTTFMLAYCVLEAALKKDSNVIFVTKNHNLIQLKSYVKNMMDKASEIFGLTNVNRASTFSNGSRVDIITSSKLEDVHSSNTTPSFIYFDDYAFLKKHNYTFISDVMLSKLLESNCKIVFGSVPNGFNHFFHLYDEANIKEGWQSIKLDINHNLLIDKERIEKLKLSLNQFDWMQEFNCIFMES
jgi:hypothetical protein